MADTYTLAQVQADITKTRTAITAILENGQHVAHDGRIMTRANLKELRDHLEWLQAQEKQKSAGGIQLRQGSRQRP